MSIRRRSGYSLALIALSVSGGASILIYQRDWALATTQDGGLGGSTVAVSGAQLYPLSAIGAWVALACCVGVVATRGRSRYAMGALIIVAGIAILVGPVAFKLSARIAIETATPIVSVHTTLWWLAGAITGVLVVGVGIAVWCRGASWPSLSARYERGTPIATTPWDALDRGQDPTVGPNLPQ